jgi:4-aminobutyrate aminotransferase-like enzyme/Ser/Thr protein kinase RdoA (MazF antagonist)
MKFLKIIAPRFSLEEVAELAARHFGLYGQIDLLYSERDQNFRLREDGGDAWTLKIASVEEDPAIIDCQVEIMRHIAIVDPALPIPRVRPSLDNSPTVTITGADGAAHVFYALTYLPGQLLDEAPITTEALSAQGAMVARLGRALRGFFHPAPAMRELLWDVRLLPRLLPHIDKLPDPQRQQQARRIIEHFATDTLPRLKTLRAQLVHADVNEANMLVDPQDPARVTGIIDFGDIIHGTLVQDIAAIAAERPFGDMPALDGIAEVVRGYNAVTKLEPEEADILYDVIVARLLLTPLINAWRAIETPDEPGYMQAWTDAVYRVIDSLQQAGQNKATDTIRMACGLSPLNAASENRSVENAPQIDDLVERRRRAMGSKIYVFYDPPLHIVRGEGVWLTDASGRHFLDAYNNVPHVGHCHPHVVEAITQQVRTLNTNTRYLGTQILDYSERLGASLPGNLKVCAFVNSGSEANDIAWRMAKAYTGNCGGLTMEYAYHGITDALDAFSPSGSYSGEIAPHIRTLASPDDFRGQYRRGEPDLAMRYAAYADEAIESLQQAGMSPAAFMVDSAFLTNGMPNVPAGYLKAVFTKVRAAGGLCIADEVQSGFGRMGRHMWGHRHHDVIPDIVTIGKPAGNGHPLGVVITSPEIMEAFLGKTPFFSTFGGNNVSCAAGLAVLDVIERERLIDNAGNTGVFLKEGLRALMDRHDLIGDVRGAGLSVCVELVRDRNSLQPARSETDQLLNLMRDEDVLVGNEGLHGNIVKIRPPMVFRREHAELVIDAFDRALCRL